MKRYGLLKCWSVGFGSANLCLAECRATNLTDAIASLQSSCCYTLDATGYVKAGGVSFVVGEFYGS